jgi:hypothetical protein
MAARLGVLLDRLAIRFDRRHFVGDSPTRQPAAGGRFGAVAMKVDKTLNVERLCDRAYEPASADGDRSTWR